MKRCNMKTAILSLTLVLANLASAQNYKVLYNFGGYADDGVGPFASLIAKQGHIFANLIIDL
jgi:hypothetical protein